jgi:arylsulfatase A-like enzyme
MRLLPALLAVSAFGQTPVVVISIDTLRGDRIGPKTPNLSRWAAEGTLYENATTPVPLTLPAHTALMTSTYPFENGVESNAGSVPKGILTLASVLKQRGYRTGAFVGSIFLEKQLGLDAGFDTYDSPFDFGAFSKLSGEAFAGRNAYSARDRRPGPLVLRSAGQWVNPSQPTFLFVHLFDMHKPWAQPTYDAQATAVDAMLGSFRATLERAGLWDKALVIVTADHGEGLGDHGESDHGYFIYQSTLHIPLIVHWPKGDTAHPKRVAEPVSLIDVAPTVLDYLKIPKPSAFHGKSFLDGSARPVISASTYARDAFGWAPLRSVRSGNVKYIEAPKPELYDLATDPGEKRNLIGTRSVDALKQMLPREMARPTSSQADLKSLGYIGPGPRAAMSKNAADPKDRLPLLLRYESALDLMAARRYPAAVAVFRKILATDPGNLLTRRDLGVALIELKEYDTAIAELRTVVGSAPDDYVTRYELGVTLEAKKRTREAADQFRVACEVAPPSPACHHSVP